MNINIFILIFTICTVNASHFFIAGEGNFGIPNSGSITHVDDNNEVSILNDIGNTVHAFINENNLPTKNNKNRSLKYFI